MVTCEWCGKESTDGYKLCLGCRKTMKTPQAPARLVPADPVQSSKKNMLLGGVVAVAGMGCAVRSLGFVLGASDAYYKDGSIARWSWAGVVLFFVGTAIAVWGKLTLWWSRG